MIKRIRSSYIGWRWCACHADDATDADGDANGDGEADATDGEVVELQVMKMMLCDASLDVGYIVGSDAEDWRDERKVMHIKFNWNHLIDTV